MQRTNITAIRKRIHDLIEEIDRSEVPMPFDTNPAGNETEFKGLVAIHATRHMLAHVYNDTAKLLDLSQYAGPVVVEDAVDPATN